MVGGRWREEEVKRRWEEMRRLGRMERRGSGEGEMGGGKKRG